MKNLEVTYPFVAGGMDSTAMQNINRKIYDSANKLIVDQSYYLDPQTAEVDGYFEIKTNERGILSLSIINYTYHYHAAHGLTLIKSFTFDTQTGKDYELCELFKPESDYIGTLSEIIKRQIEQRDIFIFDEFKPISRDQDYYIADKALVIYYQLYELTAYAFGFPQFPISVYDIQDIIKEDGPLDVMLING
jgi:hypothetical protein